MAGDVSSFNQATFRDALAIQMGVSPSAIMLAVTAASVAVTATIQYPTPAAAVAAATTLTTTSVSALSAALGSTVLAVGNVALTLVAPPPSPPPPSPPSRPTLAQSLMHFGGRWSPKTTLRMATVDQQLERLYPYALLSLAASVLVLGFFCGKDGGRALKDTPLLPPSAHRSGLRSRAVLSTTLRRRLTSFMDLPSDARLPQGKAQEVITRSPCVHQTMSGSRPPWTTTTPSSLPSVHSEPSASQMPFGAQYPIPVWAAAPPEPPPRSPRTSSGFTPHLLPHATVSSAPACAAMAMAQAASERARQAVERADTASIQAAVREAETAALALMMIVQGVGERSPGRGPPPEPPPMLQDRASPAAKMDAGGKSSSLIGDARIEGDDDDDVDHAPMRPRHASARAPAPPAVQPAALTKPTALQLEHESELSYGAGVLEAYGSCSRTYGAPLNLSAALDSVAANMKGRADPTGHLREETRSPIASRGRAKKAKKALVGTSSFACGKGLHGCASAAGASPCRSPLATVAEQAEEPSLAEESSASLVAFEEQTQEASSPSPSQMQRQLTLVMPQTVAAEAARVAARCGLATPLSWLGFELVQSAPGVVAVAEVAAGSAAEDAGMCAGERLYALDGKRVRTTDEAAILLDDLSGAVSMIVSPITPWQPMRLPVPPVGKGGRRGEHMHARAPVPAAVPPMRLPVPPYVPLCQQSLPTTPIADGLEVHTSTSIAIDPFRIDVHNAAANLQRVRSTKAHVAAAAPPISSVSSRLKRTSNPDPTALATALAGDAATRRQQIGAPLLEEPALVTDLAIVGTGFVSDESRVRTGTEAISGAGVHMQPNPRGELLIPVVALPSDLTSAPAPSSSLSRSVFLATWRPWIRGDASRGEKRGSQPSLVGAHDNADFRLQSPPMSTAESPPPKMLLSPGTKGEGLSCLASLPVTLPSEMEPRSTSQPPEMEPRSTSQPPEMEPAWLVDAIVPMEHSPHPGRSREIRGDQGRSHLPVEHPGSSADAPASWLSSQAAKLLDERRGEQPEESVTTTMDGWVYKHAPGERWAETELAEQAVDTDETDIDETDMLELAEQAAPKAAPKEKPKAAVTTMDGKAEAATAASRGAAAMAPMAVAEARAAVQKELETKLQKVATFGAVVARGGPASEAPGTTEIAYDWLGREEARVDSTTPSPPLLGRRPSTPVAE